MLTGKTPPLRDHFYWEFHEGGFHHAVRRGGWKLVRQSGRTLELYDLKEGASEWKDLAARHPDTVQSLTKLFETARTGSDKFLFKI